MTQKSTPQQNATEANPNQRGLLQRLREAHAHQVFFPHWWNIFTNSFYFSRRGLSRGIARYAHHLRGRLLDFGCGAKPYQRLFTVEGYVGVDIEVSGHDHSSSKVDVYYDGRRLPFSRAEFDSVFASEVFEHFLNLDEILKELYRVLKPGGVMLLTMPFCWDQHEVPYDYRRYTEWGLQHVLREHGFEIVAHEKTTTYIETLASLAGAYFYKHFFGSRKVLSRLMHFILIAPIFVLGTALSKIMPDNGQLYLNHVVLVQKT